MSELAYTLFLGKPLIFWGGTLALLLLILAALVPLLNKKGIHIIPQKWHQRIAGLALLVAIMHGISGLAAYL